MRTFLTIIFLISAFSMNAQYIRFTKAYGKRYVYLRDVAKYYGMSIVPGSKTCELRSRYSRIVFSYQKRAGIINGVKVNLMNAPFIKGKEPVISENDFLLLLDPVLRKAALKKTQVRTIMIDPGHGKRDSGALGARFKEKDIVLQISKRVRDILKAKGYRVLMTRSTDLFPSLNDRADLCNKLSPDIFVSIHCNAAGAKSARGIETYCLTPAGEASSSTNKPEKTKLKANANDKENSKLAYEIQKGLIRHSKGTDRGIKHSRFFVLKNIKCPGVLIETGFLSNRSEENLLGSSAYQQKIANGIVEGILTYNRAVSGK